MSAPNTDNQTSSDILSSALLVAATVAALLFANLATSTAYTSLWQLNLGPLTLEHWINDGLMAVFFLLIGLELERALYVGHLAEPRKALLPIVAAIGGMAVPAMIHFALNKDTPTQPGFGIPMATDIAFALGVLTLLRNHIPVTLKIFVIAYAVIDDLGAIVVIATVYTSKISIAHLLGALGVWIALVALNRFGRVMALTPYLVGGAIMWTLMLQSGIHATLAGVLLAFAIPFRASQGEYSPSAKLEHALHKPVTLLVLPIFALANAGITLAPDWASTLVTANALGIMAGLLIGKPAGVIAFCWLAIQIKLCQLPPSITWNHVVGAGLLGGIGFTMSIFIANLAFQSDPGTINASKVAILLASLIAGTLAAVWLRWMKPARATSHL